MAQMGMTRRDALHTFLGAGAATLIPGCGESQTSIQGEIVGTSDAAGHRLRDGTFPRPGASASIQKTGVAIVGAGVAGLAAARALKRAGRDDFVVLELESDIGGTSRSGHSSLISYPWGAHYLPLPRAENTALIELLDEIGVLDGRDADGNPIAGEQFIVRDPQERIFHKARWQEGLYLRAGATPEDLAQYASFKKEIDAWIDWRDGRGRRAFTIPVAECSDDAVVTALDKMSMADWLASKSFTSPRLKWYVEYACRDDYGSLLSDTSAWAGLFYFASRVRKSGDEAQPLLAWPEGNGHLVAHLFKGVQNNVRTRIAVCAIEPSQEHATLTCWDIARDESYFLHAQKVIFCAPQFIARRVIAGYSEAAPHSAEFQYGAWMVANLHLRARPNESSFPLCWDNVLYDSPSLGYVVATHQTELDRGPTVFTYYYPLCDSDPKQARAKLLAGDWQTWSDVALADLRTAHPEIRSLTERIDVMRWGHAMIRPRPGFLFGGAREKGGAAISKHPLRAHGTQRRGTFRRSIFSRNAGREGSGYSESYFTKLNTSYFESFLRPGRKLNSMTNPAPMTVAPSFSQSCALAAMVPPVASRSSTSSTCSPGLIASSCIARVSWPYSRS